MAFTCAGVGSAQVPSRGRSRKDRPAWHHLSTILYQGQWHRKAYKYTCDKAQKHGKDSTPRYHPKNLATIERNKTMTRQYATHPAKHTRSQTKETRQGPTRTNASDHPDLPKNTTVRGDGKIVNVNRRRAALKGKPILLDAIIKDNNLDCSKRTLQRTLRERIIQNPTAKDRLILCGPKVEEQHFKHWVSCHPNENNAVVN
ncbi:hypothetical protein RBB50_002994 [Rhinocladiella similis]